MQKLNSGALNRILLFVYILSLSTNAIAQNKNNSKETYLLPPHGNYVYGRVIEKLSKEPMVGVTIRLDGHSTGVITDINGCYVLTLPEKGGLVIYSYIGFETRKIKVTSRQKVDVQMVEATESIQEVIVTGYNSIQKESFTGNTTKIEKEELLKVNPNNLISAIQTFDPSSEYRRIWLLVPIPTACLNSSCVVRPVSEKRHLGRPPPPPFRGKC